MSRTHPHTLFVLVHVTHPPHSSHPSLSKRILSPSNVPCAPHFRTECAVCAPFSRKMCHVRHMSTDSHKTLPTPHISLPGWRGDPQPQDSDRGGQGGQAISCGEGGGGAAGEKRKNPSAPALPGKNLSTPHIPTPSHPLSPAGDGIGASAGNAGAHDPADRRTGRRRRSHTGRVAGGGQAAGMWRRRRRWRGV